MSARSIGIPAAVLGSALVAFFLTYGGVLFLVLQTRWEIRNSPQVWLTPKPLVADTVLPTGAPKLSYFGYEFDAPVPSVKEERKFDSGVILSFSDCAGMSVWTSETGGRLVSAMQESAAKGQSNINAIFGTETLQSDYALRSRVLNLTPASLDLFSSRQKLAGAAVLLILKKIETQRFKNGLYSFQSPWMRGFQEGDITRDGGVVIEAYDAQDRQVMLIVGNKLGRSCFSQTQLNQIIFSLKPSSK